ncbi:AmpG family muropeptide MFS transporter [Magnetospirillum sulfuroxidans]|uniref:AmpG family muropeptide MFS transporter n=1 Tax=Magnetospirillum sulfuroxidans TaxID=611300 RepID=A0ABS5IFN7_9PROT|nr:AmpG family muropeptide MFS transporter [Magnetospirillum sulfuroxidans]MBR9972578.1 AmpG family muropeptide MFS transporter [Magnetospirillum sulfuroxidans]
MSKIGAALAVYGDRRILTVLLLGFSSGLPLALTGATLAVWLTEAQVSLQTIGFFALVGVPYTFKFAWAPLIDQVRLPFLSRRFGRRRAWMLSTQVLLIAALAALGANDPALWPELTALLAVVVAFCSASQDIVIDAYRVEILDEEQYGAGAAAVQLGYRVAMLISGAGALLLAQYSGSWAWTYWIMAALVGIGMATVLANPEPQGVVVPPPPGLSGWLRHAVADPFMDMARRQGWMIVAVLAFVLLYKLGDAFAGVMANPFYVRMGFSKAEIAAVSKVFGFGATIAGTVLGGILVARYGLFKSLLVCGVLQMVSNLMFAWQAVMGHNIMALTLTIAVENFSGGLGSAAFVAYMSGLCSLSYTGTQYALLSSLAAVGRTLIASSAGVLAERLGWVDFFLVSTAVALPGLLLLVWMMRRDPVVAKATG